MASEIKNLKKAAERIKKAVKNKENIILYGDADMDGVSSVIIVKESIKTLGGKIAEVYFPDRETEGYGVNEDALEYLKKKAPALMIIMDCGIGNFDELDKAKEMGFEVVIVDHHEVLKKLPTASIVVDPKQKGDKYPFKEFATVGIAFKLAQALLGEKMTPSLRQSFLELTALATIADMMPQTDDNKELIEEGLSSLRSTVRPGLRAFFQIDPLAEKSMRELAQKIISAAHAGGTQNHLNEAYILLTAPSLEKAEMMVRNLLEKSRDRHLQIQAIAEEIGEVAARKMKDPIVFEGSDDWPVLMLGPAASKICRDWKKPVFLYNRKEKESQGAVRTPKGVDGVKAMIHCSKLLGTYGGHPQAAGFRVKNEKLEDFKECLFKYFKNVKK